MTVKLEQDDFIVTARDVVSAGICIRPGLSGYLEARGYSLRDFIRDGLPSFVFVKFNDAYSERVLAKARERLNG